jgi:imidazolonepropionase-like amidohydrolase
MTFPRVLVSLTTAPASRFGYSKRKGSLATGMDGDMVVLGADPASSLGNFGDVRYTIRGGLVLYQRPKGAAGKGRRSVTTGPCRTFI